MGRLGLGLWSSLSFSNFWTFIVQHLLLFCVRSTISKQYVHKRGEHTNTEFIVTFLSHYEFSSRDTFIVTDRDSGVKD